VPYGRKYCDEHEQQCQGDRADAETRGYGWEWQKARKFFLKRHPWCIRCKAKGRLVPATVVDHIKPHRGDAELFWDETNWQPLCKSCHDHKTMTEDRNIEYKY
jgi:5-methylcytosine-specific restriction protein A